MKEDIVTLDEFKQEVIDTFKRQWPNLSQKRVDDYFQSSEAKNHISNCYEEDLKKYLNGEIAREVFRVGCAVSCGYCLSLMYDGPID